MTYHVLLDDGRIVRRHVDHVHKQVCDPVTETDSHIDNNDVSLDLPSIESNSNEAQSDLSDAEVPPTTEVRRSNRTRHPPACYQDDSWTT